MAARAKVLIVEDDSDLRRLYAIGLNQRGFEVKLASNGAEALVRLEGEHPDVILLDLQMPVMTGWDVLDRIEHAAENDHVPVIVISGQVSPPEVWPHDSIVGWLSKPVALDEISTALEKALPRKA